MIVRISTVASSYSIKELQELFDVKQATAYKMQKKEFLPSVDMALSVYMILGIAVHPYSKESLGVLLKERNNDESI